MRILLIDIETAPNTAYVWGLFNENIPLARLIESSQTLCWAAKWLGEPEIMFSSIENTSHRKMLKGIHKLLDEADAVVHYNGTRFDIPTLNKEFILHGMSPPAPYKQIDLLRVARHKFKFPSNKLDYVSRALGLKGKHIDTSFELWVRCMNKDPEAWKTMEEYNINDVLLLEKVYERLLPWIHNHPNHALYSVKVSLVCPHCGGDHYQRRGFAYTNACKYQRYQCKTCDSWFRGTQNLGPRKSEKFANA